MVILETSCASRDLTITANPCCSFVFVLNLFSVQRPNLEILLFGKRNNSLSSELIAYVCVSLYLYIACGLVWRGCVRGLRPYSEKRFNGSATVLGRESNASLLYLEERRGEGGWGQQVVEEARMTVKVLSYPNLNSK